MTTHAPEGWVWACLFMSAGPGGRLREAPRGSWQAQKTPPERGVCGMRAAMPQGLARTAGKRQIPDLQRCLNALTEKL